MNSRQAQFQALIYWLKRYLCPQTQTWSDRCVILCEAFLGCKEGQGQVANYSWIQFQAAHAQLYLLAQKVPFSATTVFV